MGTLYILGNGLDLHFGLQTGTEDFLEILKTKSIYNSCFNARDVMSGYGVNWSDYEESLAYMDLEEIESSNLEAPDYLSDHESDRDGVIANMQYHLGSINEAIFTSLSEMISNANEQTYKRGLRGKQRASCGADDAILSFNYTSTIENLFDLSPEIPLWHIHGHFADEERLIFGYGEPKCKYNVEPREDEDFYVYQQRKEVSDFYQDWMKKPKLCELQKFLLGYRGRIDKIYVYGHSLGIADLSYMEMIEQMLCPTEWLVSYHGTNDKVLNHASQYSFKHKIRFFPW